ncbi:class II aldolase/adducin family protein [Neorhizobium sp. Rsf11]|uniref:Class II aldolase/adducin family protein n=2 Tax=Neorhizobium TaxID=1525371 RepID=A0ABV0MAX4_9HYPH|nr:class II aldolase/adducin family protein [Neorhizobium petrolearium]MCC2613807.1 class II aldolase/adducin family protein [Neorhizobium petrolearium]WGI72116.1 class II aldolase/adducin family protein [Neorhizobium petrolearium]
MSDQGALLELVQANRILAHERVLDAFGHVSIRDTEAGYHISRSRSPELVSLEDIQHYDADSKIVGSDTRGGYLERVIHGAIYRVRPDVRAVCHFHSPSIMPFCVTGRPWMPVTHLGATVGMTVPFWDEQAKFGDTDMLVSTAEQGASLAAALRAHSAVLLRNHGAVVVGGGIPELVMRSIQLCRNADVLMQSLAVGEPRSLTPGEVTLSGAKNLEPRVLERVWDYHLSRAGLDG